MNILIVGNGFDLSHYLPTKYDHFMDVMDAIEFIELEKPIENLFSTPLDSFPDLLIKGLQFKIAFNPKNYEMDFDKLFNNCNDKNFIKKTKDIYETNSIQFKFEQILKFKKELSRNVWYQYFQQHVKQVKTWIDFESKINEVLKAITQFFIKIELISNEKGLSSREISFNAEPLAGHVFLTRETCNILELLKIVKSGYYAQREFEDDEYGVYYQELEVEYERHEDQEFKFYIKEDYVSYQQGSYKIKVDKIMSNLHQQLEKFIAIFNQYLELIVARLEPKEQFKISSENWNNPNKVFSFNYTNTYQRLYDEEVEIDFLHGKSGDNQNIVLGVSDIEDKALKNIKAYGFTKYHQKLFKDTDYLFLDKFKKKIVDNDSKIQSLENTKKAEIRSPHRDALTKEIAKFENESFLNLQFYIWGHSLDESDREYILDLFSLNDDVDRNVRVIVYYYQDEFYNSKFDLLNNLIHILGKDKVEQWMKNRWLKFEPNPEINFGT